MKKLVLEVLTTKWVKLLRVKDQTHRENEFGALGEHTFTAKNGFVLRSFCNIGIEAGVLYTRGYARAKDDRFVEVPSERWLNDCRFAVKEYNEYFSDKKTEPNTVDDDIEVIE